VGVMLTRGPDAILERGSTVEMILDRTLKFEESELEGLAPAAGRPSIVPPPRETQKQEPRLSRRPWPGQ
jgi:type IV secretion system protein VirB10